MPSAKLTDKQIKQSLTAIALSLIIKVQLTPETEDICCLLGGNICNWQ